MPSPLIRTILIAAVLATPALAELAPITTAPGIAIKSLGVFCNLAAEGREDAPETELGYIDILSGLPEVAFQQREIPARLGVSFGLAVVSDRDIPGTRNETRRPGAAAADIWYDDIIAGEPDLRGFSFDFEHELQPGIWRMEAYDGPNRLYSVEFDVLSGTELPGVSSDCNLLS